MSLKNIVRKGSIYLSQRHQSKKANETDKEHKPYHPSEVGFLDILSIIGLYYFISKVPLIPNR